MKQKLKTYQIKVVRIAQNMRHFLQDLTETKYTKIIRSPNIHSQYLYIQNLNGSRSCGSFSRYTFFIGNSIFHLSLELLTKFWNTSLKVA